MREVLTLKRKARCACSTHASFSRPAARALSLQPSSVEKTGPLSSALSRFCGGKQEGGWKGWARARAPIRLKQAGRPQK